MSFRDFPKVNATFYMPSLSEPNIQHQRIEFKLLIGGSYMPSILFYMHKINMVYSNKPLVPTAFWVSSSKIKCVFIDVVYKPIPVCLFLDDDDWCYLWL